MRLQEEWVSQATLADLGIGFVQNFSASGMTSIGGGIDDVPNGGMASYNGNWVAAVQCGGRRNGNGDISLRNGAASLSCVLRDGQDHCLP